MKLAFAKMLLQPPGSRGDLDAARKYLDAARKFIAPPANCPVKRPGLPWLDARGKPGSAA
jgi:hypothetical protein